MEWDKYNCFTATHFLIQITSHPIGKWRGDVIIIWKICLVIQDFPQHISDLKHSSISFLTCKKKDSAIYKSKCEKVEVLKKTSFSDSSGWLIWPVHPKALPNDLRIFIILSSWMWLGPATFFKQTEYLKGEGIVVPVIKLCHIRLPLRRLE